MMDMTLVKSLHSGDPDVPDDLAAGRHLADALQLLFGLHPRAVHLCSCIFLKLMHWGEPCREHSPWFRHRM
jgi:hypothetical protein